MKLYSESYDYARLTCAMPAKWQRDSRRNPYLFRTREGVRTLEDFVARFEAQSVLDYGCGHSAHGVPHARFDPFIPEYSAYPGAADLVVCYNVLNVVETDYVEKMVLELCRLARKAVLLQITAPGFYQRDSAWYTARLGFAEHHEVMALHGRKLYALLT